MVIATMHGKSNTIDYCYPDQEPIKISRMMVDTPATAFGDMNKYIRLLTRRL